MTVPELLERKFQVDSGLARIELGLDGDSWFGSHSFGGDDRLNHVQPWVEKKPVTVQDEYLSRQVNWLDFSDDRLESVLDVLRDDVALDSL